MSTVTVQNLFALANETQLPEVLVLHNIDTYLCLLMISILSM